MKLGEVGYIMESPFQCVSVGLSLHLSMCLDFVQTVSSELLNLVSPNVVWWCIIMGQSVMSKNWVAILKVKITVRAYIL